MPLRKPASILLAGLALGVAFDRLFRSGQLGINAPVFIAAVLVALALSLFWQRLRPLRANIWLVAPLLFLAAMIAVRANTFVTFLNVCAVLMLLAIIAVYLLRRPFVEAGIVDYLLVPLVAPVMSYLRAAHVSRHVVAQAAAMSRQSQRRAWAPILRGVLLASPVVLVFGLLLASADTIFAELINRAIPDDLIELLRRVLIHGTVSLVVGITVAGGLAYALWSESGGDLGVPRLSFGIGRVLGFTESTIVVNAVNVLFLAFVIVQVPYLFGGQLNITPEKFTYAEYARRGFGELVAVSVLVLGLLLLLGTLSRREGRRQFRLFNLGSTFMVALTVVMLVSAFKRLMLYELTYGYTEMRLYPHIFMVWLALLLGWFVLTLWSKPARFAVGLFVACLGFVVTLNLINPDDFIVRRNLLRETVLKSSSAAETDHSGPEIDAMYLTTLSDDAIPALVVAEPGFRGDARALVGEHLNRRYTHLTDNRAGRAWPAFHLARRNALAVLSEWKAHGR